MKKIYQIGALILFLFVNTKNVYSQLVTQTLNFTGSVQTLTVPACVPNISFTVYGAQGANGASTSSGAIGGNGGLGAMTSGVYTLSGASTINVYVGGAATGSVGGYNGGGNGVSNSNAGAGGGASDVRLNGNALTDRIIVAGGGGGGGNAGCTSSTLTGGNGGAGGGVSGTAGLNSQAGGAGQGGVGTTGGAGGIGCSCCLGSTGGAGTSGLGGNGGFGPNVCAAYVSGGGGGGGYVGGGAGGGGSAGTTSCTLNDQGAGGGGAGGTNYFASAFTGTAVTNGTRTGNGLVVLSYSIGVPPTVVASGAATICSGALPTLTASGATTYSWSTTQTTSTISVSPTINTSYTVMGQSFAGCSNTAAVSVSVNALPSLTLVSTATSNTFCSGTSVSLTASGANTYSWSTAVTGSLISVSPSVNTIYTFSATSATSLGACTNTVAAYSLSVVASPTVNAVSTPTAICLGTATAVLSASGAVTYSWNTSATTVSISVSPAATTIYTVTGYNTGSTCVNSRTVSLAVNALPTVAVTSATTCSTYTINLTASGASTYSWNTTATTSTIAINPTVNTSYTVTGTSTAGCTSSAVSNVTVYTSPSLTLANSSPTICSGNTATLTATGAPTITWVGVSTVTNGLAFLPSVTGNYTAYGTSAQGCTNTAITSISVTVTPNNFPTSSPPQLCIGNCGTITVTGAASYTWLPMNLNTNSVAVCPTVSTTYTVIKANANCVDTKTFVMTVNNLPGVILVAPPSTSVCVNNTVQLVGVGANTYSWYPGSVPGSSFAPLVSTSTIYTLTGSNGSCTASQTIQITAINNPTISIAPSSATICRGFCTTLTAGGAVSYTWVSNPVSTSGLSGSVSVDCPTLTTSYTVSGLNAFGCKSSTIQVVIVNLNPAITATANPVLVCIAGTAAVGATSLSGTSYSWSTGASTRTTIVSPLTTSVYSVTATFTATQCKTTNTVSVGVFVPVFAISGPTSVCVGGTIVLSAAPVAGFNYTWTGGGQNIQGFPSFAVSPTVPTIYVCTGSSTLNGVGCVTTNTYGIAIYQNPTITAVASASLPCRNDEVFLTAGGAATYVWSSNQTGSVVPIYPAVNSATYIVIGTDANGCPGTASLVVKSSFCPGFVELSKNKAELIIYPNPSNGEFTIQADQEMNLKVIDELGRIVKSVTIKEINGYESKVKGLSSGVYFIVGDKDNTKIHQKIIVKD